MNPDEPITPEMRDPAVLALYAVRITVDEHARLAAGLPIVRPFWPPVRCRGSVVGLQVDDEVVGEARLTDVSSVAGGASWAFGPVTPYLRNLPHTRGRGMSSPMPAAPHGTLTPARDWLGDWTDGSSSR